MERREFLKLAAVAGLGPWYADMAFAVGTGTVRIRKNAAGPGAQADLDTFARGVEKLKRNGNAQAYRSWMYWANCHGTPDRIPPAMDPVWYQCEHGTRHFLTWHRAYLFFFEALIRDVTGADDFALPYWDWYASPALPAAFVQEAGSNPLYHRRRRYQRQVLRRTWAGFGRFDGFHQSLEGNPHGSVHVMVGGDMGDVERAARDPVFYAHHANVDRLWRVWLTLNRCRTQPLPGGNCNPSEGGWLRREFAFDVQGQNATTVGRLLKTRALGYDYDSLDIQTPSPPAPPRPAKRIRMSSISEKDAAAPEPQAGGGPLTLASRTNITLDGSSVVLESSLPPAAEPKLANAAEDDEGGDTRLVLVLENVAATDEGIRRGADYSIYLNLPAEPGDKTLLDSDLYVGNLNSFALSHRKAEHEGHDFRFDLSRSLRTLIRKERWQAAELSVAFVSSRTSEETPLITVGAVRIEVNMARQ